MDHAMFNHLLHCPSPRADGGCSHFYGDGTPRPSKQDEAIELLRASLQAFNEIPCRPLRGNVKYPRTYDIAAAIEKLLREREAENT